MKNKKTTYDHPKLKTCFFCEEGNLTITTLTHEIGGKSNKENWKKYRVVNCDNCGASGPQGEDDDEAVERYLAGKSIK